MGSARDERLEISVTLPSGLAAGDSAELTLTFRNVSDEPVRIYMLPEPFRAMQSIFKVNDAGSGDFILMTPEPRPHGIVVSEDDFHLIPPGGTLTFTQSLPLADSRFTAGGRFLFHWSYENRIERWAGGAMTLDGPTRELFGGGPIPHIWTGRLEVEIPFEL